jgi:hypothetical protein
VIAYWMILKTIGCPLTGQDGKFVQGRNATKLEFGVKFYIAEKAVRHSRDRLPADPSR